LLQLLLLLVQHAAMQLSHTLLYECHDALQLFLAADARGQPAAAVH
jgi:hypothetical protein